MQGLSLIPLAITLFGSFQASANDATPDISRFDGHYKLVRQTQGYEQIWAWACPSPTRLSDNGGVSNWNASKTCSQEAPVSSTKSCAIDLYIKGEIRGENGMFSADHSIFYSAFPLHGDPAALTTNAPLKDDNIQTDTCKQSRGSLTGCFFDRTFSDYFASANRSTPTLVANKYRDNKKRYFFVSLEKKNGLLIFTNAYDGSSTNGRGTFTKDSELRLKCEYRLVN